MVKRGERDVNSPTFQEQEGFSLTTLSEYDAVLPQLLLEMELRGENKTHPELYNKVRAAMLDTYAQRMMYQEGKMLSKAPQEEGGN